MHSLHPPTFETTRLLLKELTTEVLDQLFTTFTDEDIMSFLGLPGKEELDIEKSKWQGGYNTYRSFVKPFLIVEKESGKAIGRAGFHNWYPLHKRAELGYALTDETAKQKGYTTEAVKAILAHGFEEMQLFRVEAYVGPSNIPSLKIIKGMGFTEEGTLRSHFCRNGVFEDSICFALLRDQYHAIRNK